MPQQRLVVKIVRNWYDTIAHTQSATRPVFNAEYDYDS